jgi:Recombination endonuclease VII
MLAQQDNKCAIRKREFRSMRDIARDHCHVTGLNRALLCMPCNSAQGWFDDLEVCDRHIEYREKWAEIHAQVGIQENLSSFVRCRRYAFG